MKSKKLLFINDFKNGGGAEEVIKQTINILKEEYCIKFFYGSKEYKKAKSVKDYIFSKENHDKLLRYLFTYKPDIIFVANYYHILSPSILAAIKKYKIDRPYIKVIMTAHDFHILCPNSGFRYFSWFSNKFYNFEKLPSFFDLITKKYDKRGIHYSLIKQIQWMIAYKFLHLDNVIDIFISPSEFLASFLKKKYNKNVFVVRNPLPIADKVENILRKNKHDELKLVFIGRVSEEKGLLPFIKHLQNINDIEYTFTIIGNGEEVKNIKYFVESHKIDHKIQFKNKIPREEVLKELENYDVLVLPSLCYENAPLSLVEGAIKGLGLLTMDYGGMKEIAEICGNYYLLKKDYSNLKEALKFFSRFKPEYNIEEIKNIFSIENYKKNLIDIIEGLK